MKVTVNNNVYQMGREQFKNLVKIAKGSVKRGIVAIEKNDVAEMRKDTFKSKSELNKQVKEFEAIGYKVYTS